LNPPQFQGAHELQQYLVSEIAHWRTVLNQVGLAASQ